ncbi:glycosyltransferase family 4 protein [Halovenus halobia]|uniref:glycosyltransferase family 4 protein n=1 Tax=Halovenus halobia TaxID=3396622 RepID=UPI003F553A91
MLVSHYFEFESHVTGGISESVSHQRKMLRKQEIPYTTKPRMDADVLHCNVMGPRSAYYARKADCPVVAHTHVTAEDFGESFRFTNALAKPLRPYLKRAYGLADELVCPSEYNRGVIDSYTDRPTRVITNGVDTEKLDGYESLREEYLDRYDLSPPVVFLVGHVIKRKGLETFVETARNLPDVDFAWFGPIDRELKGRSTKRLIDNSPSNCTFTGFIDDIRGAFAAGDIFFFPTYEENEGIALLEAMAAGKPPVVRDIETFSWLTDGDDAVKSDSDEGFIEAIHRLEAADERERIGEQARERSEPYHLDSVAPSYEKLYTEVGQ